MDSKDEKHKDEDFHYNGEVNLRSILRDAIRMQALYTGNRVKIIETSKLTN
jgi:hypothetical protein